MATIRFNRSNLTFKLLGGEMYRVTENNGEQYAYYLQLAKYRTNKVLFYHDGADKEIVNYVKTIIDALPEVATEYLVTQLRIKKNVVVRCWYSAESGNSAYEIYYDADDCLSEDNQEIAKWMNEHNDWSAEEYRFTEVINGHQTVIGE